MSGKLLGQLVGQPAVLFLASNAAQALVQELEKPPAERTWEGYNGFVPYNFRPPTPERIRQRFWNPEDPRILTETVFGAGWAINLYQVLRRLHS